MIPFAALARTVNVALWTAATGVAVATHRRVLASGWGALDELDRGPAPLVLLGWVTPVDLAVVLVVGLVVLHPSIAAHEIAHWVSARRSGTEVTSVQIGTGPRVLAGRRRATAVAWHLLPQGGVTVIRSGGLDLAQRRRFLKAGLRAQLLIAAATVPVAVWAPAPVASCAVVTCLVQLALWVDNAVATPPAPGQLASDGWQLHRLAQGTGAHDTAVADAVEENHRTARGGDADPALRWCAEVRALAPDEDRWWVDHVEGSALVAAGRYGEGAAVLARALATAPDSADASAVEHAWLDARLTHHLVEGAPLVPEQVRAGERFLDAVEQDAARLHTRAMLLIADGRPADAVRPAVASLRDCRDPRDRAVVHATLVIAQAAAGNVRAARQWLDLVPPDCPLRDAAERAVQ